MKSVEPHLFVIFGGTGDLSMRKLIPSLFHLQRSGDLEDRFHILGVARKSSGDRDFQERAKTSLAHLGFPEEEIEDWCSRYLSYQSIDRGSPEDYLALKEKMEALEKALELPGNRVFYLALPSIAFPRVIRHLGENGLESGPGWVRLVVEKPFGEDLSSAQELNRLIHRYFDEAQIYRIDHYLGKETVQNLLVFRFANALFESLWNRDRVERVEITVAEPIGVEGRAEYYDKAGALRDMVQNHLTQLLTLVAMEVPATFEAEAIRHEKVKVLSSVMPIDPENVVFGQYIKGVINGKEVPGYREEPGVSPDSSRETFVALRLEVANWRWQGVSFILRTGKRLQRKITQIAIVFRCAPVSIFKPFDSCSISNNILLLTLQPDEGFSLSFEVKAPGESLELSTQKLRFQYQEAFGPLPDAYRALILDILQGDRTLFVRADEVEASWRLYTPILQHPPPLHSYAAGTWGPKEANRLLRGFSWVTR